MNFKETNGKGMCGPVFVVVFLRPFLCILFVVYASSGQILAQERDERDDRLAFLSRSIAFGTVEQKREALFQIRNLRTEWASRLAVPSLEDRSEIVRATAAGSVVFLPADEAAQLLLPLLNDKAEFVRREAAYALGKTRSTAATAQLIRTLGKDKVFEARTAAAIALGEIGDASAVDALTTVLKSKTKEDDEFLRRSAARSVGQIAQIIKTGKTRVLTPQNFLPDKYKVIANPKDSSIIQDFPAFRTASETLTNVLRNDSESPDTRREAAFALGAIGDESAVTVLTAGTNSEDPYLAEISREALLKLNK